MRGIKTLIDKLRHGKSRKQHHKLKTKTFPSDADEFFPHLRAEGVALPSHHRRAVFQIIPCNCWKSCNTWEVVIHAVFVHACLKLVHDGSAQNSTRCHKWAYLVQWCRAARRTQWLDCCFWAPAFYPAGVGSLLISNYRAALCATFYQGRFHTFLTAAALLACWPIWLGHIAPNTFLSLCIFNSSALSVELKGHGLI